MIERLEIETKPCTIPVVGRSLSFMNSNKKRPKNNQRVIIYVGYNYPEWLASMKFVTAIFKEDLRQGGKCQFVLDCGGNINVFDGVSWAALPIIESDLKEQYGDLPF